MVNFVRNKSPSFLSLKAPYQSLDSPHFGGTFYHTVVRQLHKNKFEIFFRVAVILPLSREMDLCLVLIKNRKNTIFAYRMQTLNRNSIKYSRLTNCYGKANKKHMVLAQGNVIRHSLFDNEPIGKILRQYLKFQSSFL